MAKESNKNFPNSDQMLAFGLETEGNSQNQKQPKSKTMKENEEGSSKKRRFAVVETQDLDVLIKDSLAKKNETDNTMGCFSVYRSVQLHLKMFSLNFFLHQFSPTK